MKFHAAASILGICALTSGLASAATRTFNATMNGAQEVPTNASTATGSCTATLDDVTGAVSFSGTFTGLNQPASLAHIHGLAGPGVSAGVLVGSSQLTNATAGTFSGAGTLTAAQVSGMLSGLVYCNVHDSPNFPSGEIRGQLTLAPLAPALGGPGLALLIVGLGAAGALLVLRRETARQS